MCSQMFPKLVIHSLFLCFSVHVFTSHLSTSSAETPKLPQRMMDAVKSYIYTPEEGKSVTLVLCLDVTLSAESCEIFITHKCGCIF